MVRRITLAALAVAVASSCATGGGAAPAAEQSKETQEKVGNITYFDMGVCSPRTPELPEKITKEALTGVVLLAQPLVLECLVDPKNRGPEEKTTVVIDSKLTESGVQNTVSGTNLTDNGRACVQAGVDKWTGSMKHLNVANALSTGKGELASKVQIEHQKGVSPTVVTSTGEISIAVGAIRLAEPSWCDCYADWKTSPPTSLVAKFIVKKPEEKELTKDKDGKTQMPAEVAPSEVTFEPTTDATATNVAQCLRGKLMAMKFPTPKGVSYGLNKLPFLFVNSASTEKLGADANPGLQFTQFDLLRTHSNAQTAVAIGNQMHAQIVYDDLVQKYLKTKEYKLARPLKEKCQELLKADDRLTAAFQAQSKIDTETHDFAAALKAKDPKWSDAEQMSAQAAQESAKQVEQAKKQRVAHAGACPKEHY